MPDKQEEPLSFNFAVNERRYFEQSNPKFLQEQGRIDWLYSKVFRRSGQGTQTDVILFSLGLFCWDDYQEVMLMAAHGRGFGALKILRGMYERTVTLAYLQKNPDEAYDFYLYEHIRNFTMANELKQSLSEDVPFSDEQLQALRTKRDEVLPRFKRRCLTTDCDREVQMFSWTKRGIPEMASVVDKYLRKMAFACYYTPLTETHATFGAAANRATLLDDGGFMYGIDESKSRDMARIAMVSAHQLIVGVFAIQTDHFKIPDVKEHIDLASKAIHEVWPPPKRQPTAD